MGSIVELKDRKKTVESFLRSNSALKSVASVRLLRYKNFLKKVQDIMKVFPQNFLNQMDNKKEEKAFNVVIGCNQGMCGEFSSKITNYLNIYFSKYEDAFLVLGKKFNNYAALKKNVILKEISLNECEIMQLANFINEFMIKNNMTSLIIHVFDSGKIIKEKIIENRIKNEKFNMYEMFYLYHLLYKSLHLSAFFENKERILNLEQASINAENMHKKIVSQLNRIRQEKITNSLNEIIVGVLL